MEIICVSLVSLPLSIIISGGDSNLGGGITVANDFVLIAGTN